MRKKAYPLCLIFMLMATQTSGQALPAGDHAATIEAQLRKTVGFLRVEYLKGSETWDARGTCFFVSVEHDRNGQKGSFGYLVTNRHVASPEEGGIKFPVLKTWLSLNLKQHSNAKESEEGVLPIGRERHWSVPGDNSIDLAVLPLAPNEESYDFKATPLSMFATQDQINSHEIEEGDRLLFAGYFHQLRGLKRVRPIVREGILAMIPEEDLETTLHKPGRVYLIDAHSFAGNSGAPVFVQIPRIKGITLSLGGANTFPYLLLGVVSGYYYEDAEFKLRAATTLEGKMQANSGISIVVPAEQLKALLNSPELRRLRDVKLERKLNKSKQ